MTHIFAKSDDPQDLVADLLQTINLKQTTTDVFVGPSFDYVGPRIFGGQVLAQALMAAAMTLEHDKPCHSLHGYFLRGGDIRYDVHYQVRRLRDGRSLSAREVIAVQYTPNDAGELTEQVIFSMIASFSPMEGGLEYQKTMPSYPDPQTLLNEQELKSSYVDSIPDALKTRFMRKRHVEIKPIEARDPITPKPMRPRQANWLRISELGEHPVAVHQALLAFASDFYLVGQVMLK